MPAPSAPTFLESPTHAWVTCDDVKELGVNEVLCSVPRIEGSLGILIAPNAYINKDGKRIWAIVVGTVPDGCLVDFPSGDRLAVPEKIVMAYPNGHSV